MTIAFNSSLLFLNVVAVIAPTLAYHSTGWWAEISIEVAEAEDSSMEVAPAGDFSPTELAAEGDDFAMEVESDEVESEVKFQGVELSEKDDSVVEGAFCFLVDSACGPSSTSSFRLADDCVSIV